MTVSEATGDLFDPSTWTGVGNNSRPNAPVDAIGHGVNCQGVMGSGIAVEFKRRYPAMYRRYALMCQHTLLFPGQVLPWVEGGLTVFNIASQYRTGRDARLDFLEAGLLYSRFYMKGNSLRHLALPRIGAGIGGLDWDDVKWVVNDVFGPDLNLHVTLVSLEGA